MTREYFASLEPRPDDPILGLVELYKNDPRDTKVNLGVGIYLDNEGRLPLMKAVGSAEQRLAKRGAPHGYIPMSGLPAYCAAIQKLVFGATNEAVLSGRIATIQSLGGTGALRLGAVFAHEYLGLTKAVVSNPTWGNHITLFEHAGLKVDRYPYLNKEKNGVDFEAMKACLEGLEAGTVVLLHAATTRPATTSTPSSGPRSRGSFRNATCFPSSTSPIRASAPALTTTQPPSAPCAPPASPSWSVPPARRTSASTANVRAVCMSSLPTQTKPQWSPPSSRPSSAPNTPTLPRTAPLSSTKSSTTKSSTPSGRMR